MDAIRLIEDRAWETVFTFDFAAVISQETLNAPIIFQEITVITGAFAIYVHHVSWALAPVAIPPGGIQTVG